MITEIAEKSLVLSLMNTPEDSFRISTFIKKDYFESQILGNAFEVICKESQKRTQEQWADTTFSLDIELKGIEKYQDWFEEWSQSGLAKKFNSEKLATCVLDSFKIRTIEMGLKSRPNDVSSMEAWLTAFTSMVKRLEAIVPSTTVDDSFGAHLMNFMEKLDSGEKVETYSTGLADLDKMFYGGIAPNMYGVVAGRPGQGKSSTGLVVCNNFIINSKNTHIKKAMFMSLEMGAEEATNKIISLNTNLATYKIKKRELNPLDRKRFDSEIYEPGKSAFSELSEKLYICDRVSLGELTITNIENRIRREVREKGLSAVFIDQASSIAPSNPKLDVRQNSIVLSAWLRNLSKELNIVIILLVQLNRGNANGVMDISECDNYKQDADFVWHITRDGFGNKDGIQDKYIDITIDKNRHGIPGKVELSWVGLTGVIGDLSESQKESKQFEAEELASYKKKKSKKF